MYHNIKLMGCYWPGMMTDCINIARSCHDCQIHGDFKHQPPVPLHPTIPSWPFDAWGIDVIGMIDPPSSGGQCFILAATDYFSRRAEAIPLREVKFDNVINFLERHIIYRFGIHRRITWIVEKHSHPPKWQGLLTNTRSIGITPLDITPKLMA